MNFPFPLKPLAAAGCLALAAHLPARPVLHQTLPGFDNPISCAFSLDGSTLYVVNSARGGYGWVLGKGALSKVGVADDGTLTIVDAKFVTNLNGPMSVAVLPVDVGRFAAGTIFVSQGGAWVVDRGGDLIRNTFDLETGVVAIDPETGGVIGKFLMGPGTEFANSLGHGVVNPLGIGFDPRGYLYLCDGGSGGRNLVPPIDGRAGVVKIPPDQLARVAAGEQVEGMDFLSVSFVPTTVFWDGPTNSLMATTGGGIGPLGGAVFRLPSGDFSARGSIETVGMGLGLVSGAFFTPERNVVAIVSSGEIRQIRSEEKSRLIRLKPQLYLVTPGEVATRTLASGEMMVVIPEQSGGGIADWRQQVQVLLFPADS